MSRYIDADELYKATQKRIAEANEARMAVVDDEFLDLINDAFTEDVAPRAEWISVEERLPEVAGREYLVWDDVQATVKKRYFHRIHPNIPIETYPCIREYFGNASDYKRYTHWMPLPEPPKGD